MYSKLLDQSTKASTIGAFFQIVTMLSAAPNDRSVTVAKGLFDRIQQYFPDNKDCLTSSR